MSVPDQKTDIMYRGAKACGNENFNSANKKMIANETQRFMLTKVNINFFHQYVHSDNFDDQMEVETFAQAKPEIHDDNEFAFVVVDVEACALQYSAINSDAEQLNDNSDDEEMPLDDAQKDSATQQKNGRFESIVNLDSFG
uniref:Uncharacterized protein n=1 Tax=Romanomermis culicivorax TaxID=13658 RepID=A0A915L2M9_ROMCU